MKIINIMMVLAVGYVAGVSISNMLGFDFNGVIELASLALTLLMGLGCAFMMVLDIKNWNKETDEQIHGGKAI